MNKPINMMLGIAMSILLFSCNSDEPDIIEEDPAPDFSITSTDDFEIVSRYPNGWIKEAIKTQSSGNKMHEVTYHENGYLNSYKVYYQIEPYAGGIKFEHQRSEQNLPISSKYYDTDGNLHAELGYENGLLTSKKIYGDGFVTESIYEDDKIISSNKEIESEGISIAISYDYETNEKSMVVTKSGEITFEKTEPLGDILANAYDHMDDMELLNVMDNDYEISERRILTGLGGSITQENYFEASDVANVELYYSTLGFDDMEQFGYSNEFHSLKGALNGRLFRGVAEQYPFNQGMTFVGLGRSIDREYSVTSSWLVDTKAEELENELGDNFSLLYGNTYVQSYVTGKYAIYIGTLRNLPTDSELRQQLIDIAFKHTEWIAYGTEPITEEESELLDRVFFEFKVHGSAENFLDGIILSTHEEYLTYVEELQEADNQIVQLQLREY
jgi:hypothetical protein